MNAGKSHGDGRSRSSDRPHVAAAIGRTTSRISRLIGRSVTLKSTGKFLRQQLWAWPIIAAVLLGLAGWWVNRAVENSMREQRVSELTTILNADVAALRDLDHRSIEHGRSHGPR